MRGQKRILQFTRWTCLYYEIGTMGAKDYQFCFLVPKFRSLQAVSQKAKKICGLTGVRGEAIVSPTAIDLLFYKSPIRLVMRMIPDEAQAAQTSWSDCGRLGVSKHPS